METYFDGERLVQRETERERAGLLNNQHRSHVRERDLGEDSQTMTQDQPCGGGRRVIRKRIGVE